MNKYFREFLINNHIKPSITSGNKSVLCVDRGRAESVLFCSFFSILVNLKYKLPSSPIIQKTNKIFA